jgi:hypothetical protein
MSLVNYFMPDNNRLYFFILPVLIFIIVPGFILQENYSGFSYLDGKFTIVILSSAAVISTAMLFLLNKILVPLKLSTYFGNTIRFITYLFICTGLIAPLSSESGMVDPGDIPIDWFNLFISLVLAVALYIGSNSRVKKYLSIGLFCFLGINLVTSLLAFNKLIRDEAPIEKSIYSTSSEENVFVISFDGLPRDATIEVIQENPEITEKLKDFIIYKNVISSSPATVASIFAELQGNRDYKKEYKTTQDLKEADTSTLLTNYLDQNGFLVSTYSNYNLGFENPDRSHRRLSLAHLEQEKVSEVLDFFDYTLVRIASSHMVLRQGFASSVRDHLAFFIAKGTSPGIFDKLANHKGEKWDKKFILTKFDYDTYVSELNVTTSSPTAHFLHFTHTHFPVDFNSRCEYMSHDQSWYSANQNRDGAKNEVYCVLQQFSLFIEKLKELGIYQNSMIIFKSDHGKPVNYHDKNRMESFRIRRHELWGYGRYTPFLAIKDFDQNFGHPRYDDNPVMTDDLAKTICLQVKTSLDCKGYSGYDLLEQNLTIPHDATSVIFIGKDSHSDHQYTTHEALHLIRKKDFYSNLHQALTNHALTTEVSCQETIQFETGYKWNNGNTDNESWATWHSNNSSFIKFRPGNCNMKTIELDLYIESGTPRDEIEFDIFFDGVKQKYGMEIVPTEGPAKKYSISVMYQPESSRTEPVLIEARPAQEYGNARVQFETLRQY